MKGYVFTYGVDGFGADVAPAYEEGCYTNFSKAFAHLIELNHDNIYTREFYEDGYGVDYYPNTDKELAIAEELEEWEEFDRILNKHRLTDEIEINQRFINCDEPPYGFYGMEEIEIKED